MTWWRHIPGLVVGVLLLAAPAIIPALPNMVAPPGSQDEDESGSNGQTLALDAAHHGRRTVERQRPTSRTRSAVVPPHRHHAVLVRPQSAPVPFLQAVNGPLHC